jgi:hypothetical protein
MKITIEGTREEIADALRRLAAPEDIKPAFAPHHTPKIDPVVTPFIPYEPATTAPLPHWPTSDRVGPWWGICHPVTGEYTGATFSIDVSYSPEGYATAVAIG